MPSSIIEQDTSPPPALTTTQKGLLACGIISALLYMAMLVIVPMFWEGYSSASQTISELSAIGAPTRPLWVALGHVYTLLMTAFGWGVWLSAGESARSAWQAA